MILCNSHLLLLLQMRIFIYFISLKKKKKLMHWGWLNINRIVSRSENRSHGQVAKPCMYIQFYSSFALKNALSKSRIKFVGKPGSIIEECLSKELSKCSCFEYSLQGVFFPDIKMFHLTILLWYYQETNSDVFFYLWFHLFFSI